MTGTIKLIRIILLMVLQHGGDDVSCKRRMLEIKDRGSSIEIFFCIGIIRHPDPAILSILGSHAELRSRKVDSHSHAIDHNMAPRLSVQTSLFLVLFSLYPSLSWEKRAKRNFKNWQF